MFEEFPKIARLNRDCVVTEKLDGTNAHVWIEPVASGLVTVPPFLAILGDYGIAAGSRTRFIYPTDDNYGFAKWVVANAEELITVLGPGRHYGEWWGQGVQRNYGLKEKRFSLFNTSRWTPENVPSCCHVVPVLYSGKFRTDEVEHAIADLKEHGSMAAPGFMKPEGVVVYHTAANRYFKVTTEKDESPKGIA